MEDDYHVNLDTLKNKKKVGYSPWRAFGNGTV